MRATIDNRYQVHVHNPYSMQERPLTQDEVKRAIGTRDAVKVNFIPHMLTALAMDYALRLCDRARDLRLKEIVKQTRIIRAETEGYARETSTQMGDACEAYDHYLRRFDSEIGTQRYLSQLQLSCDAANQLGESRDAYIAGYATMILLIFAFVDRHGTEVDKMLTQKLGVPVWRDKNQHSARIAQECRRIGEAGYHLDPSRQLREWVKIFSNKASMLADEIMAEEGMGR